MARPRKMQRLNDAKSEVIAENFLKQDPEGQVTTQDHSLDKVVLAKHVPEYRKINFLNGRDPGYPLDFHYSSKTHPLKIYKLLHGKEYNLPVEIIEHLESLSEPQYGYRKGMDGHPEMFINSRKFIFQCRNVPKNAA